MGSDGSTPGTGRWGWRRRALAAVAGVLAVAGIVVGTVVALEAGRIEGDAEEAEGLASFYVQPDDAAAGAPGSLVKSEELIGTPIASRAWRIMYRSTDLEGTPIVVTGIVITPSGSAPPDGRTVLAWGHPTTGTDPTCAPSRAFDPFIGIEGLRMMLDRGYTVVATDYAGMGTEGPDSYLVGETAARSVLDSIRAAREIPDAQAGGRAVLWGHSQGGQAVLFAAENAADYAPEIQIVAVAAAAPAADLTALVSSHLDDISGVTIGSYAFPAFADVYGQSDGADLETALTPAAIELAPAMNRLCLLTHLSELHTMGQPLVGDFFANDPTTTEPWATLLADNSAGSRTIRVPLFIAQGTSDELVLPADTLEFVDRERAIGVGVTYVPIASATHATIAYLALPALDVWLDVHAV